MSNDLLMNFLDFIDQVNQSDCDMITAYLQIRDKAKDIKAQLIKKEGEQ